MSKVDCKDCQFYHNGRCEELGEYTTPGECECSWFAQKAIKKPCVAEIAKNAKQDGERMSKVCRDCFHFYGVAEDMNGEVGMCELQSSDCPNYKVAGQNACKMFNAQTVFHRITASPEVLAEKLVVEYRHGVKDYAYYSTVTWGLYNTKAEALAATVAKLKEVCVEQNAVDDTQARLRKVDDTQKEVE